MQKICKLCERLKLGCFIVLKISGWVTSLLFLPDSLRKWLFSTGTRALEALNGLTLLGWAITMLSDSRIYLLPTYSKFNDMPIGIVFLLFCCVGTCLLAMLPDDSRKGDLLSGRLLCITSLLWALVLVGLVYSYPPVTPSMVFYFVLAAISYWAGLHLVDEAKHGERRGE